MSNSGSLSKKIPVAILGATGSVGQRFIELLENHPWFEIVALAASERSVGKTYGEVVRWLMSKPLTKKIAAMPVVPCVPDLPCRLVFSALDSSVAGEIEKQFSEAGYFVVSNASNHRMDPQVPLLIPEVNAFHVEALKNQKSIGRIVTNPNCCVIGLALALKPLHERFGIESMQVVTMQAISGAGYPGVASLDIMDNIVPYIHSEEKKLEEEPLKILGDYKDGQFVPARIRISAQCNRVPVTDGHTECISLKFKNKPTRDQIIEAWKGYSQAIDNQLPTSPQQLIQYHEENHFPQPKLHRNIDKGMAVSIGRLRECPLFDYKFVLLSHNTIRGAAGGALLCAEYLYKNKLLFHP